jgi:uncharacterized protein YndB with AHSA1/START domain
MKQVSVERYISVPPDLIFDILARPSMHTAFDGSGTVRAHAKGPARLSLGSRFGMRMRIALPYRITNTVVEFEEGSVIAWRHFGGHIWRYELRSHDGGTLVTESFDWSQARSPAAIEAAGYPERNRRSMEATLARLDRLVHVLEAVDGRA